MVEHALRDDSIRRRIVASFELIGRNVVDGGA